ncbi:Serine/threonine-protein kinase PknB [Rubripirellula lacrimiformis]|uniref:Serine/threonine-protein kinase PknB n=1 Tax=Rubripirellula lacrimiformis TaxID=1930273 RepID=A0A517NA14_9BACT|nr:serine/threonine-protein kinase [Rubripirellula lacrimiformis]QDT03977.1 Serine/threonine-protein kinase PknB [Rubripirellula lacrimiformis]
MIELEPSNEKTRDLRVGAAIASPAPTTVELGQDPVIGRNIGNYRIDSLIGRGGMGSVYRAHQCYPVQRDVALKLMTSEVFGSTPSNHEARARFVAEGQVLAAMHHNEIACLFDASTSDRGEPYFVMELVDGVSLATYCHQHRLTIEQRIRLVQRICRAVHAAHQSGVVHRDLKPDNILVCQGSDGPMIKIIDFGIAKVIQGHDTIVSGLTACDQFIGTPGYLSPEQAVGNDVDARADVFSIGAILFELLCGSTPINQRDTPFRDFSALRRLTENHETPRPSARVQSLDASQQQELAYGCRTSLSQLVGECQRDLDWVVLKSLAPDRIHRYATAADFADDLQRFLDDQPTQAAAPTLLYQTRKLIRRRPATVLAVAAACVAIASGMLLWSVESIRAMDRTRQASLQSRHLLDQARMLQISIATSKSKPTSSLVHAAVTLEQTRQLLRDQPQLSAARDRLNQLETTIHTDESAFDLVSALDSSRLTTTLHNEGQQDSDFGSARAIALISDAFNSFGLNVDTTPPRHAAAKLRQVPRFLLQHIIESLDFWIGEQLAISTGLATPWPADVLSYLDTDPLRQRLRMAILAGDHAELTRIAEDGLDQHFLPFSRVQLANALAASGKHPHAIAVLRRGQASHPSDFWVNHTLATMLSRHPSADPQVDDNRDSLHYYAIAVALRPEATGASLNLAEKLWSLGHKTAALAEVQRIRKIDSSVDRPKWANQESPAKSE